MSRARAGSAKPTLALSVQYASTGRSLPTRAQLRRWASAALRHDAQVTLRLVDGAESRTLNRRYRGKDRGTNVLTFVYRESAPLVGDIVLCVPVIARESRRQRKELLGHYAHLVVHGMLHLQGYDHERRADADAMETLETEIVIQLGYADPYSSRM